MGDVFNSILKSDESLFLNELALSTDFIPPIIKFRENENKYIATCIKPLFRKRDGKNLFVYGTPGIGKTLAIKSIYSEMEEKGLNEEVVPLYINCWKTSSTHKILYSLCEQLGVKYIHNRTTEELLKKVSSVLNKKSAVICFDECDKVGDMDIFYMLEDIYRKTLILITNEKSFLQKLDSRIQSRLQPELLEFKPYTKEETGNILKQRAGYAFVKGVLADDALQLITRKTFILQDIRLGVLLLKESGAIAEDSGSRKISLEHANKAVERSSQFRLKNSLQLNEREEALFICIQKHPRLSTSELHKIYDRSISYKSFRRYLTTLEKAKLVRVEEIKEGAFGRKMIVQAI